MARNWIDIKEDPDIKEDDPDNKYKEMEHDRVIMHDNDDDNNDYDNEDLPPPNEKQSTVTYLIPTEALDTLQQYCQQNKVKSRLSNMVCSLELNLRRMQLHHPKYSPYLTRFFSILPNKNKNKSTTV